MNENEKKLLVRLLRMAVEEFSNHGCNDFKLDNNYENRQLLLKAEDAFVPLEHCEQAHLYTQDWLLMSYFADKLEAE